MHRTLTISALTLSIFAAMPQAEAQMRDQIALDVIGGALGGGLAGAAGVLTRVAVDAAMQQPAYSVSHRDGGSTSPISAHAANDDRFGVRYNKPCSSFDAFSGGLSPCEATATSRGPQYAPDQDMVTRPTGRHRPVDALQERTRQNSPRVVRASTSDVEVRRMIAATVASNPHFGGWSIIGVPRFVDARLSSERRFGGAFGAGGDEYCVSATMIVAGIPQQKSAYVSVYRTGGIATARVRPGACIGQLPFPELELAGSPRQ